MQGAGLGGLQVVGAEVYGLVAVVQGLLVVIFGVVRAGDYWAVARSHDNAEFLGNSGDGGAKLRNHFLRVDAGFYVDGEGFLCLFCWLGWRINGGGSTRIVPGRRIAVCYTVVHIPGGKDQEQQEQRKGA